MMVGGARNRVSLKAAVIDKDFPKIVTQTFLALRIQVPFIFFLFRRAIDAVKLRRQQLLHSRPVLS
jgi:hypothetical protein